MRQLRFISIVSFVLVGLLLSIHTPQVLAEAQKDSQLALSVSPTITEMVLDPGAQKKVVITVYNKKDEPVPVKGSVTGLAHLEGIAVKDQAMFNASKWFSLSETEFILQPLQQKQITVIVTAPPKAEPGGHYATIFFQPLAVSATNPGSVAYVGTKVGVHSFLTVTGNIEEKLESEGVHIPAISQQGPINFEVEIYNSGNVHLMPIGTLEIYDHGDQKLETLALPSTLLLPSATKKIPLQWNNRGQNGYFKAKLQINYGAKQNKLVDKQQSFLILPWLNTLGLLLIITLVAAVAWKTRGNWGRAFKALIDQK